MNRKVIAGFMVAATLAAGVATQMNFTQGTVSKASKLELTGTNYNVETQTNKDIFGYEAIMEEENYIAKLVSKGLNKNVSTSDWEICLDYLEDNLNSLLNDASVDSEKVISYVEAYQAVRNENIQEANKANTDESQIMEEITCTNNGYDANKAAEYINTHWDDYNENFPDYTEYGGDCANFVSQCLYAGGMQMSGSDASNFGNWFCRTSETEQFNKVSSTWRGAEAFASYWKVNAIDYFDFTQEYFEDRYAFKDVFEYANVGDAISIIGPNGRPYHTTIVSQKNNNGDRDIKFASHTTNRYDQSIFTYVYGGYIQAVRIYKMSMPSAELEASYDYDSYDADIASMEVIENGWSTPNDNSNISNNTIELNNTNQETNEVSGWRRWFRWF